MSKLIGGPQLKARLVAVGAASPDLVAEWADDAAARMRRTAPNAKRSASKRFTTRARGLRAAVYGAFWWIFVDRGTKAHTIFGSGRDNPPDTLRFSAGGKTIFAKKVRHPRTARRPFISVAAQQALASSRLQDVIVKAWNTRRLRGAHRRFI